MAAAAAAVNCENIENINKELDLAIKLDLD